MKDRILKVLPLPYAFTPKDLEFINNINPMANPTNHLKKITPIFNRNGMYYNRITKFSWIEVNEKAYEVPNEYFLSDFDEYDHVPLTDEVYKSIKILLRDKIDYKKLYKIYKQENFRRWCRETEIIAGKTKLNILKGKYKK